MAYTQDQSLLLVIILSAIIILPNYAQVFNCDCDCKKKPKHCGNLQLNQTGFEPSEYFSSPMCYFEDLVNCVPRPAHGSMVPPRQDCTHWKCCKLNGMSMSCGTSAGKVNDGNCKQIPSANQNCYFVDCTCKLDFSSKESSTQSFASKSPGKIESSTTQSSISSTQIEKEKHQHQQLSTRTSLGIGLGLGLLVLVSVMIALMAYCRKQGVKQGKKQSTTPLKHNDAIDRENLSLSDYAEIGGNLYLGEQTFAGTTNPGYETVPKDSTLKGTSNSEYTDLSKPDIPIKSHYQSLKKHSNDFESPDYIDPEKYTKPPHLKMSDEHLKISDEQEDEDDYVKQGTPSATKSGNDYVGASLKDTNKIAHNKAHFAVTHDTNEEKNSDYVNVDDSNLSKGQKPSESNDSSDYVDVDDQNLLKGHGPGVSNEASDYVDVDGQNLLKGQTPSGSNDASDYVDVDGQNLSKGQTSSRSNDSSDYVDVDDPSLVKHSKPSTSSAGSDNVDFDDPKLTKKESNAEPDSDYVKV